MNVNPLFHFKPPFIHMLLFSCSFPFPLFFLNCFDFLCLQTPSYTYFVSSKDLGVTFKDEFSCAHFQKAVGRYMAQRLDEAVGGLRWPQVGVMWQHVGLGRTPTAGSWKITRLTSVPVSLTFLPSRSPSERITSLSNVYHRDASSK